MAFATTNKVTKPARRLGYRTRVNRPKAPVATINRPQARKPGIKPTLGNSAKPMTPAPTKPALVGQKPEFDPAYYNSVDTTDRKESAGIAGLEGQEQAIKHDFGIDDPTNPFSRANGLKKAFLSRARGASAGLAARGQLYSGSHERALARTRSDEEQARAQLRASYEAAINGIGAQKTGIQFASEEDRNRAFEDWLARAPEADAPITPEAAPTTAPVPVAAGQAPAAVSTVAQPTTTKAPSPKVAAKRTKLVSRVKQVDAGLGQEGDRPKVRRKPRPKAKSKGRR